MLPSFEKSGDREMFVPTMPGEKLCREIVATRNPSRLINRDGLHLNTNKDTRGDTGKTRG